MNTLMQKIGNAVSNTILFAAAIAMAGLGFAVVGTIALFGLMAVGVALIAAPFVAQPKTAAANPDVAV